jgi:hypothetical protein
MRPRFGFLTRGLAAAFALAGLGAASLALHAGHQTTPGHGADRLILCVLAAAFLAVAFGLWIGALWAWWTGLPLVVVRPALSKPFSLPDGMKRRTTELERFNRAFHLFSIEPYAATALIDARTIEAIHDFDRRFSVEIGGSWVLVHAPRLSAADLQRLIEEAAGLARVFPRIAGSLYPKGQAG